MSEREEEKRRDRKQSGIGDNVFDFTNKSSGLTQADVDLLRKCQVSSVVSVGQCIQATWTVRGFLFLLQNHVIWYKLYLL